MKIEPSEKIREGLELRKEMPLSADELFVERMRDEMKKLPPLPIGWRYEIHTEIVQKDGNYFQNISFYPRQEFIVQGD